MMESPVQGKLARRVRWGGCRNVQSERDATRCVLTLSLQERKEIYKYTGKGTTYNVQAGQLPEIKEIREEYKNIHSQVLQDALRRVDRAFQSFFRRIKNGEKAGYPRYAGKHRYDSFTYPQGGYALTHDNRLCLSKIGTIKVKLHRALQGKIKTVTIKKDGEHWHVIVRRFGACLITP